MKTVQNERSVSTDNKHTTFAGDVLKLVTGTSFAQALSTLATPVLSRLYAPEAFGVSALFFSFVSILLVISCMRYELAIMLPENDHEAANLVGASLAIVVLVSSLSLPAIWLWGKPLLRMLNAPELCPYLWAIPVAVLFGGMFLPFSNWNSRKRQYGSLSMARVTNSICTISTQSGTGFAGYTTAGSLIAGRLIGSAVSTLVLGSQIWRHNRKLFTDSVRLPNLLLVLKRYIKFPAYSIWSSLLNTTSWQLPLFLLSGFFSSTVVGYYSLGFRILQLPASLIGGSIGQVFYQRSSIAKRDGSLQRLVEDTFHRLAALAMFPTLLLMLTGGDLFAVMFGETWRHAGVYSQILAPWTLFLFIQSPISSLFIVFEKQQILLVFDLGVIAARSVSLILGGIKGNDLLALSLFSISGVSANIILCLYLLNLVGMTRYKSLLLLVKPFLWTLPFLGPLALTKLLTDATSLHVFGLSILSSVAYYGVMIIYNNDVRAMINYMIPSKSRSPS